jgi:hypothetical protein
MTYFQFRRDLSRSLVAIAVAGFGAAQAAEPLGRLEYVLGVGASYSDNVERVAADLAKGTGSAVVSGLLRGKKDTGRLRYEINGDYARYQYFNSNVSSAGFGSGLLRGSYDLVPEMVRWNADVIYEQQRNDLVRPAAPTNQDEVFRYSTGPTLKVNLAGALEGLLDGRYSRVSYGKLAFDNESVSVQARLQRRPGPRTVYGFAVSHEDVTYIGAHAFDFTRQEAFVTGNVNGLRTRLGVEAGLAKVSGGSVDEKNPLLRLNVTRRLSPYLSAYAGYRQEFPTSSGANLTLDTRPGSATGFDTSTITATPRISKAADFGFTMDRPRSKAELSFTHSKEVSLNAIFGSRTYDALNLKLTRVLTPTSRGSLYSEYSRDDLSTAGRFNETVVGLIYSMDFSPVMGLDSRIEHRSRTGSVARGEYKELTGGIFLRYTGGFGRAPRRQSGGTRP